MKKTGTRVLDRMLSQLLRPSSESPLARLETSLSRPTLRLLLRLDTQRRQRRRRAKPRPSTAVGSATFEPLAPAGQVATALRAGVQGDPARAFELMRSVLRRGGYETASALADLLAPQLGELASPAQRSALETLSELHIAYGDEAAARALWHEHAQEPPARIAARLTPEGPMGSLAHAWPARGAPDLTRASQLATRAELSAAELAERVLAQPLAWLQYPELELLLHQLKLRADPYDVSSLSRYLERQGLARCWRGRSAPDFLSDLQFAPSLRAVHGPLLSVLMATKDAATTLPAAIDSILRQSYANLELLVADDASSDGSLALLQQRYASEPRVSLFASPRSQGPYNLRNALLAHARGELITFHDADDLSLPSRFARQVRYLEQTGHVACVSSWLRLRADGSAVFFGDGHATRLSLVSLLVTRRALAAVGPYPRARFAADLDIAQRLAQRHGELPRVQQPLLLGLWSSSSLTRSRQAEALESGYRSPARRRYSELLFRRDLLGPEALPEALLEAELVRMENYVEPVAIEPM